jgi:hypothetical protein
VSVYFRDPAYQYQRIGFILDANGAGRSNRLVSNF